MENGLTYILGERKSRGERWLFAIDFTDNCFSTSSYCRNKIAAWATAREIKQSRINVLILKWSSVCWKTENHISKQNVSWDELGSHKLTPCDATVD